MKEGGEEARSGANAARRAVQFGAQGTMVLRAAVRKLVALEVAPHILVGIELGTVRRQMVNRDPRMRDDEVPGCTGRVRAQPIPHQFDGTADVAQQVAHESDGVATADGVTVKLEVEAILAAASTSHPGPVGDGTDSRCHAPVPLAVAQDGRRAPRCPGARHVGSQPEATLVGEDDGRVAVDSPFLIRGHSRNRQRRALRSSRSRACRSGRCHDQPCARSRFHTCDSTYRTPRTPSIAFDTRARVHSSVPKPNARGPAKRILGSSTPMTAGSTSGFDPRRGWAFTLRRPPVSYRSHHCLTASRLTSKWRATSAWLQPFFSSRMPSNRRHSRAFVLDSFFAFGFKGACSHHPPAVKFWRERSIRPRRGRTCLALSACPVLPSTKMESVGSLKCPWLTPRGANFAAQWPARMYPCRRFVLVLADDDARLGASVVRYSFTVGLFHSFQLAGFDRRTHFWHKTASGLSASRPACP